MQDLASEFSKNFPGVHSGRGRPPPTPNTQPGLWPGTGRKRPGVGTQTLVPLNVSAVVAPPASFSYGAAVSSNSSQFLRGNVNTA